MNMKKKISIITMFCLILTTLLSPFNSKAATTIENDWQRYDDYYPLINYIGSGWQAKQNTTAGYYNNTAHGLFESNPNKSKVLLKFIGTKIRILGITGVPTSDMTENARCVIDGKVYYGFYKSKSSTRTPQYTIFEITGLSNQLHTVEVYSSDKNFINLDAIDIDSNGCLVDVSQPVNLTATTSSTSSGIKLNWDSVTGAIGYNVYRSETTGTEIDQLTPSPDILKIESPTSCIDISAKPGHKYFYVVTAVTSSGESTKSNEASATAISSTLTNLSAEPDNHQVTLRWTSVAGATSYKIESSTSPDGPFIKDGTYKQVPTTGSAICFINTDLRNGTKYYYRVSAVTSFGEGPASNIVSATPFEPIIIGTNAILELTMTNGKINEYDMTAAEIDSFVNWYDAKSDGIGKAYFAIKKHSMIKPFLGRKEYIRFNSIESFEIKDYNE